MTLIADVKALLLADATLMASLTGGVHDAAEISRQLTPGAFDANAELLPCALIKTGTENALARKIEAVQTPLVIYFYQRSGYSAIDLALPRTYQLLEAQHFIGIWEIQFNTEIARTWDDALKASLAVQRFNAIRKR
ncbi:MAG TPA: hypothetical protein DCG54_07620 [Anaerolineae bacterium]|jgi:hypothetical protein|nr:hypothetical protein [Anaerolineae bacterium]